MSTSAIHDHHAMSAFGDLGADLFEVQLHRLSISVGEHQSSTLAPHRANGAEKIGVQIALVGWQTRPRTFARPNPGAAILLANTGFILEPHLDPLPLRQMTYVSFEDRREVFLKSSMTFGSCAGCCGLPEM